MAELTTLARPYARAAFEHALTSQALAEWEQSLVTAAMVAVDQRTAAMLAEPGLTSTQKADTLIELCGEEMHEPARNFVQVMAENKRLPLLPQVYELFRVLKAAQERSVDVSVTSAFEISEQEAAKLAEALGRKLNRKINVATETDASLIGGVVIRTDDLVIDGSVRGRLAKLSEAMNS
jgi:F-type H+-transporting ATPase subunit delta